MITRFTATKEMAEAVMIALQRNAHRMHAADYDNIHNFIKACRGRLPKRDTVARHEEARHLKRSTAR